MSDTVDPSNPYDASVRDREETPRRRLRGDAEAANAYAALELCELLSSQGLLDEAKRCWRHAEQAGNDLAGVRLTGLYRDLGLGWMKPSSGFACSPIRAAPTR